MREWMPLLTSVVLNALWLILVSVHRLSIESNHELEYVPTASPARLIQSVIVKTSRGSPAPPPCGSNLSRATSLLSFIANLREIGCPEQTIRDIIIIADVNQLYAEKGLLEIVSPDEVVGIGSRSAKSPRRDRHSVLEDERSNSTQSVGP